MLIILNNNIKLHQVYYLYFFKNEKQQFKKLNFILT